MRKLSIVFLFTCVTALTVGCRVAFVVIEGGEVKYEDSQGVLHTCDEGSVCVVDLKWGGKVDDDEIFIAIPDSGWYFHEWNAGKRFLCGNSALPVCHLDFEWIEDNPDFPEIFEAAGLFYLMPVFKRYPRASLGDEPRTIMAEGVNQLWLEPTYFAEYTPDQVAAVCPKGICSGALPGSSIDLSGHFWASQKEVSLLFLAYHQAVESVADHFEIQYDDPPYISGALRGGFCGEAIYDRFWHIDDLDGLVDLGERYLISTGYCDTGYWFWKPLE